MGFFKTKTFKMTRKICVVITARPSYSRIKTALTAIKNHPYLELQLVLGSSALIDKFGMAEDVIKQDGFEIKDKIFNLLQGQSETIMAKSTGLAIIELSNCFYNLKPDIVVTIADRYETIATSIAASYQNIPLAHIQGGEVTGNIDEKVRHANTKLADLHLVSSKKSFDRVVKLGENPKNIYVTGCPSIDIASLVLKNSELNFDPIKKYGGVGAKIDFSKPYIIVLQHPVTTEYLSSGEQISETLNAVNKLDMQTIWLWPNPDMGSENLSQKLRKFRENNTSNNIRFFKNFEPSDFLKILINSKCLLGNSSVGIRESSYLGIPVVNIGTRQYRRERGKNVIDCDTNTLEIVQSIKKQLNHGKYKSDIIFGNGDSGKKIAEILSNWNPTFHKTIEY